MCLYKSRLGRSEIVHASVCATIKCVRVCIFEYVSCVRLCMSLYGRLCVRKRVCPCEHQNEHQCERQSERPCERECV